MIVRLFTKYGKVDTYGSVIKNSFVIKSGVVSFAYIDASVLPPTKRIITTTLDYVLDEET